MNFLLDTCAISELIKPAPNKNAVQWISGIEENRYYLSVLTLGEIEKGITKLPDSFRKKQLSDWLENHLVVRFEKRILDISLSISREWGRMLGEVEKIGKPIPAVDGLIAATASVHKLTLVTRNVSDFENAKVDILNIWS